MIFYLVTVADEYEDCLVHGLILKVKGKYQPSNMTIFRVFFSDRQTNAKILLPALQRDGDDLTTHSSEMGYCHFRTKIIMKIHVENDPRF